MAEGVRVEAPAKVNLHLAVGARRDDGYHAVETVLQAIELCDLIELVPAAECTLVCDPPLDVPVEENLALKAAANLGEALGRSADVEIRLRKEIPAGAGLGGGSSDAAAVLAGLATLWGLGPAEPDVLDVAARLGADVPFFLGQGGGTALFSGRGDVFVDALPTPALDLVLIKPSAGISTADAYRAFDAAPVPPSDPSRLVRALNAERAADLAALLTNNMESAACSLEPEVADALAWLKGAPGVLGAMVSGSGSALFGVCRDAEAAARLAEQGTERGLWSHATRTRDRGVVVERMREPG